MRRAVSTISFCSSESEKSMETILWYGVGCATAGTGLAAGR
ncbi:Uncharacterised protein [Bordetella pertussis]|nr:Uncharacterised protein [Bordetella pertussis]